MPSPADFLWAWTRTRGPTPLASSAAGPGPGGAGASTGSARRARPERDPHPHPHSPASEPDAEGAGPGRARPTCGRAGRSEVIRRGHVVPGRRRRPQVRYLGCLLGTVPGDPLTPLGQHAPPVRNPQAPPPLRTLVVQSQSAGFSKSSGSRPTSAHPIPPSSGWSDGGHETLTLGGGARGRGGRAEVRGSRVPSLGTLGVLGRSESRLWAGEE